MTNNYTYSRNPAANVCGSKLPFKFTPSGAYAPGSPYRGGGLNGQGYGITFDPRNHIGVGNFGFSSKRCNHPPPHNSVSEFTVNGKAISPHSGYTQGQVSWPQGVVSDRQGNIWSANCGNNSITRYAHGDPNRARNLAYPGLVKPFDVAFNGRGQAFVTGDGSPYAVAVLNPNGSLARSLITPQGLNKPMGIAADTRGNMWIANSAAVDVPCPKGGIHSSGTPSVILIHADGVAAAAPFTGGGLTMPWGIAVDGNNNVWVANFTGQHVSELCGVSHTDCRPGSGTGQPISPASGYGFDGLVRNTSVQVDPSGNLWITNNWKRYPFIFRNPGGYHMVVYVGVAGRCARRSSDRRDRSSHRPASTARRCKWPAAPEAPPGLRPPPRGSGAGAPQMPRTARWRPRSRSPSAGRRFQNRCGIRGLRAASNPFHRDDASPRLLLRGQRLGRKADQDAHHGVLSGRELLQERPYRETPGANLNFQPKGADE